MGGENWAFLGSSGRGNDDFELLELVPLREGVIGSDASCELRLSDPMITPRHARVVFKDGHWYVGGIAAGAPTWINDVATLPGQAVQLAQGDIVRMGNARFRFGGEPPARQGVDPRDATSRMIWADQRAEAGDPLGECVLEGRDPSAEIFARWVSDSAFPVRAEWTEHMLTGLTARSLHIDTLRALLSSPLGDSLERLTVLIATVASPGEEEAATRKLLQALGWSRPPRLRWLELGWLHEETRLRGAESDWSAVARRIPLGGAIQGAFKRVGRPRFTMVRSAPWWPAVGTTTPVVGSNFRQGDWEAPDAGFFVDPLEPSRSSESAVWFEHERGRAVAICGQSLSINGHLVDEDLRGPRTLVHGDLVEGPHFALRFEED